MPTIEVSSGAGPKTVKMDVWMLAGGMMVVVAWGTVMYSVTVVTWARMRVGSEAKRPRREMGRNMSTSETDARVCKTVLRCNVYVRHERKTMS